MRNTIRLIFTTSLFLIVAITTTGCGTIQADECRADIVVYGDASGGVVAAVAAKQQGKDVILVPQYGHLGGLTSSGLGWTDLGNVKILGGLSREFYHRLYLHYQI